MMTIGQFARAGGLTVKALRFYDERGVLVPAAVDPETGYRRYRSGQLRDAVALHALRAADVSLDDAHAVIGDEDRSTELLNRIAERREAERARQDAAFGRARSVIDALRDAPEVRERDAPGRAWVGMRWRHGPGDDLDADGETIETELTALTEVLHGSATVPLGPPWFTYRGDGTPTGTIMTAALPVEGGTEIDLEALAAAVSDRVGTRRGSVERGSEPPRREAYARVPLTSAQEAGPGATLIPALVVLGEYLETARGDGGAEVRQTTVPAEADGDVVHLEFAATVPG